MGLLRDQRRTLSQAQVVSTARRYSTRPAWTNSRGKRKTAFEEVHKHFKALPREEYPTLVELG